MTAPLLKFFQVISSRLPPCQTNNIIKAQERNCQHKEQLTFSTLLLHALRICPHLKIFQDSSLRLPPCYIISITNAQERNRHHKEQFSLSTSLLSHALHLSIHLMLFPDRGLRLSCSQGASLNTNLLLFRTMRFKYFVDVWKSN
ncbi:hypothetical protein CDAR_4291 [Caerostris darwini]|uniref:Uncharacterized protein n=1 Tax=Caerostris darwini TaxID=1538125 RepID=A0AAV4SBC1_9ARAC|nr:hypothetical protein CDAR_4291 [Caerostris darwini]